MMLHLHSMSGYHAFAWPLALAVASSMAHAQGGIPSPDGFTFYTPGSCVSAFQRSDAFYWRARQDTARFNAAADTMISASANLVRECAKKFTVATVVPRDLILLARVYLAMGDDAAALSAVTRRLTADASKPVVDRATTLAEIVEAYVCASPLAEIVTAYVCPSPPRVDVARRYLKLLDALSQPEAALGQLRGHRRLALHYWVRGDGPNIVSESEAAIAAGKRLNNHDRIEYSQMIAGMYQLIAEVQGARTGTATAPRAVIARAKTDLGKLEGAERLIAPLDTIASMYGQKGTRLVASYWLGTQGDTVRPTPGKMSVIMFAPARLNIPAFRRLQKEFGDNVEISFAGNTVGYFKDEGPLTPAREIEYLNGYYFDELHASGVMAVNESQFHRMPDGRRMASLSANGRAYRTSLGTLVVVLDKEGVIRRVLTEDWRPWYENRIAEALAKIR